MRNAFRPVGRFFCLLAWLAAWAMTPAGMWAQTSGPAMTQVTDTVYRADGTAAKGTVLLSWPGFTTADGKAVAAGALSVQLGSGGAFTASLAPNTGAQPTGVFYKVIFQLAGQEPSTEYWVIPATGSTTIGAVRAKLMPATAAAQVLTRDVADSNYIHVNGNQTLNGTLTFTASPTVPTPQNPGDAANKAYVDSAGGGGNVNLASPPAIGSTAPNSATFTTVLNDSNKYLNVNMIAQSLFHSPNVINRTLVTNPATNLGFVDTALAVQTGVVANGYTWNTQCPNGGTIQGYAPQFAFGFQAQSLICDVNAGTTIGSAVLGLAGNLTIRPTTARGNIGVMEMDSLTHMPYLLGWDYLGTTGGSEFFNWGGLFTNVSNGKGGVGVLVKSNFWNGGSPNYGTWTPYTAFQTASYTQPTSPNGYWYQVTTPNALPTVGMTGSAEPAWCTTEGCTVNDGTITWTGHAKSGEGAWQIGYRAQEWLGAAYDCINDVSYSTGYCMMLRAPDNSYPLNFAFARGNPSAVGNTKWVMGMNAAPYTDWFSFYSAGDNLNRITMKPGAETRFSSAAAQAITLNMDVNSGTGGVQFGSGGVSPTAVASVDSAGNARVNNLTVNGTCTGCGGSTVNLASPPAIGSTTPNAGAFTTLQADDLSSKNYPVIDVRAWGAVGDGKFIPDNCAMTAGSNVVTCSGSAANPPMIATAPPFAASDVGKTFWMPGAGNVGPNNYIVATIAGYISASQVRLSANAVNTVARSSATYGHDNYAAFCAISNCTSGNVPNNWYAWPRNGKQIHVPAGMYLTTHPLYVRNGDMWWGDGETASNIRLMSATNDLFVMCVDGNASSGTDTCTGDTFANGASQTFTVKGLFFSNSTMNTDMTHGPAGIYVPPEASAYKLLDNWFDTSSTGVFVNKGNGGIIENALCDFSVLLYCVAMDGGVTKDGGGAASEYEGNNFATQVLNLNSWGQATALALHGVANVEVRGLQSLFGSSEDLVIGQLIGRGSQSQESSRRVNIHDSFFQRSWTQSPGNPTTTMLDLREDCVSCSIVNNSFANSYRYDIAIFQGSPLLNVDGLLIANNQFKDSQQQTVAGSGYPSVYLANLGNAGQVTISNNHWENIGSYAVWSNQNVNLLGNTCHNPMQRSAAVNGSYAAQSCWYLSDGAANSVARDNVTDSPTYGAVGIATAGGHGATLDSSGNRSQWATCDVCVTDATGGTVKSVNERAANSGTSGSGAFAASTTAGPINTIGGLQVGGTTVVDALGNAAVNNLTVSGTCNGCGASSTGYGYLVSRFASIQAAINAAYGSGVVSGRVIDDRTAAYSGAGFYIPDSVTVELAPVPYAFTGTVTHNNGNNNVAAAIVVEQGAHLKGSSTSSNHGTVVGVSPGFAGDIIATTSEGTGIGTTAQWWHWGSIENLNISGANQTSGRCLVVENMGETSRVENIEARSCYGNNIEIIGASATQSSIRNITTMRSQTASGIRFTNLAGLGKVDGLSGDCNPTALVSVQENAAGSLTILGLKAEGEASICTGTVHDPVVLMDGMSGFNDHVRIIGGYAFGTAQASFAKFINAGNAILETDGLYITGYTNMLNDTVRSVTVPLSSSTSKQPFYYEPGGTTFANQAFTFAPGTFIQGGGSALTEIFGSSTDGSSMIAAQGNGDGTSYFTGGLKIGIPNRTQFGQPPEMMARMGSRFLGAGNGYDTNTWVFVPIWKTGDTSNRWIGDPNQRWPEVYAGDVNATTATVGTLNVTSCVGCAGSPTWGGIGGTLSSQADLQTALAGKQNALGYTPLNAANNLSDVASLATAKSNLGVPGAASTVPVMNGTGAVGVSTNYARADHVHPTDTSRVATSTTVNGHALSGNVTVTAADVGAPHGISGGIQGPTPAVTGTGAMTALYSVTIPAGTFSVGTGLRCVARLRHTTGSASVSMAWRLGSTTYTYPTAYTTGSTGGDASIEIFTFSSLTAETVNIPWASFGGTTESPYTGLAWSENVSGATTLQVQFNVANTDKLTGDSFYCTTIQ